MLTEMENWERLTVFEKKQQEAGTFVVGYEKGRKP